MQELRSHILWFHVCCLCQSTQPRETGNVEPAAAEVFSEVLCTQGCFVELQELLITIRTPTRIPYFPQAFMFSPPNTQRDSTGRAMHKKSHDDQHLAIATPDVRAWINSCHTFRIHLEPLGPEV